MKKYSLVLGLGLLCMGSVALADIFVGASNTGVSNDVSYSQVTLNKPAGVVSGNLLIASISVNGGQPADITPPSGWALISRTDNDTNIGLATYKKIAGSSEPDSYIWTIEPQARAVGGITRYAELDTDPIDATSTSSGRSSTATASSVATTQANDRIITFFAVDLGKNNTIFSTTTGFTKRYDIKNQPYGPTSASQDKLQAIAGSSGTTDSSFNSGIRDWVTQTIALRSQIFSLQQGLVSYWKLDESSGNAADSVSGNILLNNNSVSYSAGKIHNAANLSASSTQSLSISDASQTGLNLSTALTFGAWVKLSSLPSPGQIYVILSKREGATDNRQYAWSIINVSGTYKLMLVLSNTGSNVDYAGQITWSSPTTGTWYHLAATWSYASNTYTAYVNGSAVGTDDTTGLFPLYNGTANFRIGAEELTPTYFFDGSIDEVGVWNRRLGSTDISTLYNGGAGLSYPF